MLYKLGMIPTAEKLEILSLTDRPCVLRVYNDPNIGNML